MNELENGQVTELGEQILTRLANVERMISSGDICSQEFDELGLNEKITLIRDAVDELTTKVNDLE